MKPLLYVNSFTTIILLILICSCGNNTEQKVTTQNQVSKTNMTSADSLVYKISALYSGAIPCADCEKINYFLTLGPKMDYKTRSVYVGKNVKPLETQGKWSMIGDSIIVLKSDSDAPSYLQLVNNDSLYMLDGSMKRISGPVASMFVLKKGDISADTLSVSPTSLYNKSFILETINDRGASDKDYMRGLPKLYFEAGKNAVSGSTGCNRVNGEAKISGNEIGFSNLVMTKMMCPGEGEKEFMSILKNSKSFTLEEGKLYLTDGAKTLAVFKMEKDQY